MSFGDEAEEEEREATEVAQVQSENYFNISVILIQFLSETLFGGVSAIATRTVSVRPSVRDMRCA